MEHEIERLRRIMVIRNYSPRTIQVYTSAVGSWLRQLDKPVFLVRPADIQKWQYCLVNDHQISWCRFNQMTCAVRYYLRHIRNVKWSVSSFHFQRKKRRLPSILTRQEVSRLLSSASRNPRHHAILATLYSTGLRLGELLNLRMNDIDMTRMLVHVRQGKGGKDRQVQLCPQLLTILTSYSAECGSGSSAWLFGGKIEGCKMHESAIQHLVCEYSKLASIGKRVSPHTLRHCFATHLLEDRTDLRTIQALLGHRNIQATEVYLHIASHHIQAIRNPLANLINPLETVVFSGT